MGYLIAAYAIVVGSLFLYGLRLARERRTLQRNLREGPTEITVDKR